MATFQISITKKGLTQSAVQKLTMAILKMKSTEGMELSYKRQPAVPTTRADRFAAAKAQIDDAKSEMESLKEELETWKDGLPENLQSGSKADELSTAIDNLETIITSLDEVENNDVDFPGMY